MIKDIQGNIAEKVNVEMSIFPAWLWEVTNSNTGILIKRFKTNKALDRWMIKHTEWGDKTRNKKE